jgi:hypothetical protein
VVGSGVDLARIVGIISRRIGGVFSKAPIEMLAAWWADRAAVTRLVEIGAMTRGPKGERRPRRRATGEITEDIPTPESEGKEGRRGALAGRAARRGPIA